jgi:hypothetical protein
VIVSRRSSSTCPKETPAVTRRFSRTIILLTVATSCLLASQTALGCGKERWDVKVARDKHIKYFYINQNVAGGKVIKPTPTTIAKLHREAWPFQQLVHPPKWSWIQRASKPEFIIWQVTATLTKKKNEDDEDYHLILKSGNRTLVAEIPADGCVDDTPEPFRSMITKARSDFDAFAANHNGNTFNQKVRVTGLGMFDTLGHAEGTSPNGIELHPVIKIEFLP